MLTLRLLKTHIWDSRLSLKFEIAFSHFKAPINPLITYHCKTAPASTTYSSNHNWDFTFYKLWKINKACGIIKEESKTQMRIYHLQCCSNPSWEEVSRFCRDEWTTKQDTGFIKQPEWPTHFLNTLLFNPVIKYLTLFRRDFK